MAYPTRLDELRSMRPLRPRLAMLAALLDDWSLPPLRARRPGGLTFPKWMMTEGFDDDDDDDARPVLRRSRSTWATWPSSSLEDEEDDLQQQGEAQQEPQQDALVSWWSGSRRRSRRPRSCAPDPGRPRTQHELREARRRYFEPRRRESDDAHRGARVTFVGEENRGDPISAAAMGGSPTRGVHVRDVPVTREATVRDVPVTRENTTRDVPVTREATVRDVPVTRENTTRDVPVTREATVRDVPVTREATVRDVPVTRENTTRDVPVTRENTTRDVPVTRENTTRDVPFTREATVRDVPFTREATIRDVPVTREATARDVPISRDAPVTGETTLRDVPTTRDANVRNIPVTLETTVRDDSRTSTTRKTPTPEESRVSIDVQGTSNKTAGSGAKEAGSAPAWTIPVRREAADSASEASGPCRAEMNTGGGHQGVSKELEEDLVDMVPSSMYEEQRRRALQLQEENLRLKAVINSIQETNKRWQGLNAARQAYIQRLLGTVEEQQRQLDVCLDALKTSTPVWPAPAQAPAPAQFQAQHVASGPHATDAAEARLQRLRREVAVLQQRLHEARREHREAVTVLQTSPGPLDAAPGPAPGTALGTAPGTAPTATPAFTATPYSPAVAANQTEAPAGDATTLLGFKERAENAIREIAQRIASETSHCHCGGGDQPSSRLQPGSGAAMTGAGHDSWLEASAPRSPSPSPPSPHTAASPHPQPTTGWQVGDANPPPRTTYHDLVMDAPGSPPPPPLRLDLGLGRPRTPSTQYSFDGPALRLQHDGQGHGHGLPRAASPALSDALTPAASASASACYPLELSGSCSSADTVTGPGPHVDLASSSRASTPDLADFSMSSDATFDCSPPSPVQNVADARWARAPGRGVAVGLRLF